MIAVTMRWIVSNVIFNINLAIIINPIGVIVIIISGLFLEMKRVIESKMMCWVDFCRFVTLHQLTWTIVRYFI